MTNERVIGRVSMRTLRRLTIAGLVLMLAGTSSCSPFMALSNLSWACIFSKKLDMALGEYPARLR